MRKHSSLKVLTIAISLVILVLVSFPLILPNEYEVKIKRPIQIEDKDEIWNKINQLEKWKTWYMGFENIKNENFKTTSNQTLTVSCNSTNLGLKTNIEIILRTNEFSITQKQHIPYFKRYFSISKKTTKDLKISLDKLLKNKI